MDDGVEEITHQDFVLGFFEQARETFLRDGAHTLIVILFNDGEFVDAFQPETEERDHLILKIANGMSARPIDAVVLIGELWNASLETAKLGIRPSQSDTRYQTLEVWGAFSNGMKIAVSAPIERNDAHLGIGVTTISEEMEFHLLDPILSEWEVMRTQLL